MTGDTLTIDELQAYKAKAKRQRDNWKRRALKYLDQLGVARIELDAAARRGWTEVEGTRTS
jgi:hypothetical protein